MSHIIFTFINVFITYFRCTRIQPSLLKAARTYNSGNPLAQRYYFLGIISYFCFQAHCFGTHSSISRYFLTLLPPLTASHVPTGDSNPFNTQSIIFNNTENSFFVKLQVKCKTHIEKLR